MQMKLSLKIPPLPLLNPATAQAVMVREVGTAVSGIVEQIATEARQRTPVNTGILRASIATRVTRGTDATTLVRGEIFTGAQAPYAIYVEEGRRPGKFPPKDAMVLWTQRKWGDGNKWFLAARSVARHGTRAHHMFRDALAQVRPTIEPAVRAAMDRVAQLLQGGR